MPDQTQPQNPTPQGPSVSQPMQYSTQSDRTDESKVSFEPVNSKEESCCSLNWIGGCCDAVTMVRPVSPVPSAFCTDFQ